MAPAEKKAAKKKQAGQPREMAAKEKAAGSETNVLKFKFPKDEFERAEIRVYKHRTWKEVGKAHLRRDGNGEFAAPRPGKYTVRYLVDGIVKETDEMETA